MSPTHGPEAQDPSAALQAYLRAITEETSARHQAGAPQPLLSIDGRTVSVQDAVLGAERLVLLAPPGSGKSSLLRTVLASEAQTSLAAGGARIPLYVDLGRARAGEGIDELIARALRARGLDPALQQPSLLLLDHLELANDIYLMDGLEMLLTAGGRAGPAVVLACREGEWPSYRTWFGDVVTAEVLPFEHEAVLKAADTALPSASRSRLEAWLDRDPELAEAVRRPLALSALLRVASSADGLWSRVDVLEALLDVVLSSVPSTERAAYRAALADVALSAHGRAFVDGVDTMAMGLGVTRDAMIRTGAVVAHGPSLEFVEPLLARHCAAVALAARFGPQPAALLARLGGTEAPGAADVLVHLYGMSDDPEAFAAALLETQGGEEIVARCLTTPPTAPEEGVRRLLARDSDFGESLRNRLAAVLHRLGADHAAHLLQGKPSVAPDPSDAGPDAPEDTAPIDSEDRFAHGEALAEEGQLDDAATAMREAIAARDDVPAEWLDALGQLELERGEHEQALALLEKAHAPIAASAGDAEARARQAAGLRRVARAQLQLGRAEEATTLLSRAAGMAGDDAGVLADLGRARAAAGHLAAAIDALRAAIALDDLWPDDHSLLAELRTKLTDSTEEADSRQVETPIKVEEDVPSTSEVPEADAAPAVEDDRGADIEDEEPFRPSRAGQIDLRPVEEMAALSEDVTETETETEPESDAIARDSIPAPVVAESPREELPVAEGSLAGAAAMTHVARLYEESGELEAALGAYERALMAGDADPALYRRAGEIARSLGRVESAIAHLGRAAEAGDGDVEALRTLGEALSDAGRIEDAEAALRQALEVAPEDLASRRSLADLLAAADRPAEALDLLASALEGAPRDVALRVHAGELAIAAGDDGAARAAFEQAHAIAPGDLAVGLRLADLLKDEDSARSLSLLEQLPPAAEVMRRRATLHAEAEAWAEAARCWREAREAGDDSIEALAAHGVTLCRAGRPREAVSLLETADRAAERGLPATARAVLGEALEGAGRERDALVAYSAAADGKGLDDAGLLAYSRLAGRLGATDEAISAAQAAVAARPDAVEPALALADAYERHGLVESALRALRAAVVAAPDRSKLRLRQAALERELGRPEAAVATLEAALSACPASGALHGALGESLIEAGRPEEGMAQLNDAMAIEPEEARWAVALARCVAEDQPHRAIGLLRDALRLAPNDAGPATLLGRLLAEQGEDAAALSVLERAAELSPEDGEVARHLGDVRMRLGDAEGAVMALRRATRLQPDAAEVWAALGKAEERAGQLPAAEDSLARAVRLAPERGDLALRLGDLRLQRADVTGALTQLERAVEVDPDNPLACRLLGEALERDGRPNDALAWFAAAARLDPTSAPAAAGLGRTQLAAGHPAEARVAFEQALSLESPPADTRAWLAETLAALGEAESAMAQAAASVRADRQSLRARLALARAYRAKGDDFGAREALDAAAKLSSDDASLLRARAELTEAVGDVHEVDAAGRAWLDAAPADVEAALALIERHAHVGWAHPLSSATLAPALPIGDVETAITLLEQALSEGRLRGARAARSARAIALVYGRSGDAAGARRAADAAVAADAADPRCFLTQAWAALLDEDADTALAATRMARARGADDAVLHALAGRGHRLAGEHALAAESLRRAWERDPSNGELGVLLGEALQAAGKAEEARDVFQASGEASLDPATRRELGRRALDADDVVQARLLLEPLAAPEIADAEALALLAEARRRQDDLTGCVTALERALALAPERAEWHAALADVHRSRGSLSAARERYRRAVRLAPTDAAVRIAEASTAIEDGDLAAARGTLESLLSLVPEHAEAQAMLARMALTEGNTEEARERLAAAVASAPSEAGLHRELGLVAKGVGDMDGARHALEESAELDPSSTETFLALGELYSTDGSADDAIQAFEHAIATAPEALDAHLKLGRACAAAGMVERASAVLRRAGELAPTDARPGHELGRILAASGRYEQAVEVFEEALRLRDDLPELCFDAGDAWWRLHEYERAKELLERAHGLRPTRDTGRKLAALNAIRFVGRFVPAMAGQGAAR